MSASPAVGEWVPAKDAAARLGLPVDQARRRLRSGQLRGRQVVVAQGHVWEVWLSDDTPPPGAQADTEPELEEEVAGPSEPSLNGSNGHVNDVVHQTPDARRQTPDGTPAGPGTELVSTQRAREMAEYSEALLEPWRRRVEELSRETGRREERAEHLEERASHPQTELERRDAERAQARAQLAEALAPKAPPEPQNGAAPHGEERRRWWHRRFSWAAAEDGA